jgi:cytochrome c-type biogenesis protein CcmH
MLHQRIAEWRGQEPPALVEPTAPVEPAAPVELSDDAVISVAISLSAAATEALAGHATIYVIALDPSQPRPPIAVVRRVLSDLPTTVELGDRESMVPGRSLSGFAEFELIVRVSISGQPTAQPGDWYGSMLVKPAENNRIELSIDQKVP